MMGYVQRSMCAANRKVTERCDVTWPSDRVVDVLVFVDVMVDVPKSFNFSRILNKARVVVVVVVIVVMVLVVVVDIVVIVLLVFLLVVVVVLSKSTTFACQARPFSFLFLRGTRNVFPKELTGAS